MSKAEQDRLEQISSNSLYAAGPNEAMVRYTYKVARRFMVPGAVLEMGPAEGLMTELLASEWSDLTVVEGSTGFCESLKERFPDVSVQNSLFEEFHPDRQYENIILGHVLEHVQSPVSILQKVKKWLVPGTGRIFAAVPNARSLHRQAAVIMGLLDIEDELNEMDLHHGHRVIFNPETYRNIFNLAGLSIEYFGGYWLKPVSNGQIEQSWSADMLDAFMQLGERYPDIAGEIYVSAAYYSK